MVKMIKICGRKQVINPRDKFLHHFYLPLGGVRYITEELISKIAKEEDLSQITHLTLTLVPREGGKKIRYIENLGKLRRLIVLDLRYDTMGSGIRW